MLIEGIGNLQYLSQVKEWSGLVSNISPDNKVELLISAEDQNVDLTDKIAAVRRFVQDYNAIMTDLFDLVYRSHKGSQYEKSVSEIRSMYFLTAVSLKKDNYTWWLVLEPNYIVESIYNHFRRFTMVDRQITWTNFEYM